MELETINKLYLELSQVATAKTARQLELEADVGQAHHVLDLMNVPRKYVDLTTGKEETLTLLGRMRELQSGTPRELELQELLVSARAIAERNGEGTHWQRFSKRLAECGIGTVTAKTFRIIPSDVEVNDDGRCHANDPAGVAN